MSHAALDRDCRSLGATGMSSFYAPLHIRKIKVKEVPDRQLISRSLDGQSAILHN